MTSTTGQLLVISAPSGTGKSTVCRQMEKRQPDVRVSISYTTRKPRGQEKEGREYYFVDDETFEQMIVAGDFLEWAQVHGKRYGSGKKNTLQLLTKGLDVLFDIDVQGGFQIKKSYPEAILIFLLPPSLEVLMKRLSRRGTEREAEIINRLTSAIWEMKQGLFYEYHVINDNLQWAVQDVDRIRQGKYKNRKQQKLFLKELIRKTESFFATT